MEVGQSKNKGPKLSLLCTPLQEVIIELSISPLEIGLQKAMTLASFHAQMWNTLCSFEGGVTKL